MANRGLVFGVLGLAGVIALVGVQVGRAGDTATHGAPRRVVARTDTQAVPTISAADKSTLAQGGDLITAVPPGSVSNALSASAATEYGQHSFNFLAGSPMDSMTLVRLTDENSLQTDPSEPRIGNTAVDLNNRLVWLFVFDKAAVPVFGDLNAGSSGSNAPRYSVSKFWVAVDASTGEMLVAGSLIPRG